MTVDCGQPLVTVVMANFNGQRFIDSALASCLAQTLRSLEVIVVDDASADQSVALASAAAARDPRVRVFAGESNLGAAAARNQAIEVARGRWLAVVDSDDLMRPERLERLVGDAERDGADIVADDLLVFDDAGNEPPYAFLERSLVRAPCWIGLPSFIRANVFYGQVQVPPLGYLKPVIRAEILRRTNLRYDSTLRIAEDYDLMARLLAAGAKFRVYPNPTYVYRKHVTSTSRRLSRATLEPILASHDRFRAATGVSEPAVLAALDERRKSIERALAYDDLVQAIKGHHWRSAFALALRWPDVVVLLLRLQLLARLRYRGRRPPSATPPEGDLTRTLGALDRRNPAQNSSK
jgi:succinoglycan biosynthesis protein ExoO